MAQRDVSMKNQATIYKETPVGIACEQAFGIFFPRQRACSQATVGMNCPVGGAKFYERDSV